MWCWCNWRKTMAADSAPACRTITSWMRRARGVMAETNPDAPWTFGAEWPAEIVPHLCIAATRPPLELPAAKPDDVSQRIAGHAAGLIADGCTLQFGVGKIPDAILSSLS